MKLLLLGEYQADDGYLTVFQRLPALFGHKVVQLNSRQVNTATVAAACRKAGIEGILISQTAFLQVALEDQEDYIPPPGNKKPTLDFYAGSWLDVEGIPAVVLNPLERLMSISYEKFVVDRYISKLTKPDRWYPVTEFKWTTITEEENWDDLEHRFNEADLIGIDIETPGDELRSISCISYTLYFHKTKSTASYCLGFESLWQWALMRRLNATDPPKVFQNGLYDNSYFARWGAPVHNWLYDTLLFSHSWLAELPKTLDFMSTFYLRKVRNWKNDGKTGSFRDLCQYCCYDSWATVNSLLAMVAEAPAWAFNNYLEEFPLVFPAINAGLEGIPIDVTKFKEVGKIKEQEAEAIRERLSSLLGVADFNPNSPVQVKKLFQVLGLNLDSTDKAAMLKAKAAHPLADFLLSMVTEYREATKLVSNYFQEGKLWNGRLFYTFNPGGTDSGRLACVASAFWCGFQIQNIPRGDILKQCFLAEDGWYWAEPDKAQSEARCVGYLSGDENLIALVESEKDYHSWNAQAFFGIPYEKIYAQELKKVLDRIIRDLAKRTNHGANYNMGGRVMLDTMGPKMVVKAKKVLKLPAHYTLVQVCDYLLSRYEAAYPDVKGTWYQHVINTIEMTKKLISPLGWTRQFFGNPKRSKPALNSAVAHAPQNLSVSIINREWKAIWRATLYGELKNRVRIKAQIHDSLPFIYRDRAAALRVQEMMNTAVPVTDPRGKTRILRIPTDMSLGPPEGATRWSEIK